MTTIITTAILVFVLAGDVQKIFGIAEVTWRVDTYEECEEIINSMGDTVELTLAGAVLPVSEVRCEEIEEIVPTLPMS